jgi:uncharacterized protein (DUF362 family)
MGDIVPLAAMRSRLRRRLLAAVSGRRYDGSVVNPHAATATWPVMDRRQFIRNATGLSGALMAPSLAGSPQAPRPAVARVAFVKTMDRAAGTARAVDLLALERFGGRDLFVKPNCNSADPPPGSTHDDTLVALLRKLIEMGAGPLTIGDRSGMGDTREVLERKQVFRIAKDAGAKVVVFDELSAGDWELVTIPGMHWQQGFALPRMVRAAGGVVQTCCLKTHRYGGHFTLSLKNSVGFAAKRVPGNPHDFMRELHTSPHQRRMIAEINAGCRADLVVLDGVQAFVTGGPDQGKRVDAGVMLAGTDRIAVDAVGVALLRYFGTTPEVSRGPIFAQEQIARAVELGLGVADPRGIELVTDDAESTEYAQKIHAILDGAAPG